MSLFYMGGPLFMGILTLIGLVGLSWSVIMARVIFSSTDADIQQGRYRLTYIKSIGTLALVTGILAQLIGLYSAFEAIESVESVSPQMLAGGLKVSSITTLYGLLIFIVLHLIWMGMDFSLNKKNG